jgi:hypothetical protein
VADVDIGLGHLGNGYGRWVLGLAEIEAKEIVSADTAV